MSGALYVRVGHLTKILPVSQASIWRKVKNGTFPKPIKLSDRITAWRMDDINAWLSKRHEEAVK
jgi:prophage regulatory protein